MSPRRAVRKIKALNAAVVQTLEPRTLLSSAAAVNLSFSPSTYNLPADASFIAVADFNGDGIPDIATANLNGTVSILLGNGDGTFAPPRTIPDGLSNSAGDLLAADINTDGRPDLVLDDGNAQGQISVLLGNGDGTFQSPIVTDTGLPAEGLAAADFNGDDRLDLVTANTNGSVSVLLGNDDGTFQSPKSYSLGHNQVGASGDGFEIQTANLNGDVHPDIVATDGNPYGKVSVLLNNGDGTFGAPHDFAAGPHAVYGISVADFNNDGKTDIVATNRNYGSLTLLAGNGDGTFKPPASSSLGFAVDSGSVGDLNGDGIPDAAFGVASGGVGQVDVLLNTGDGKTDSPQTFSVGSALKVAALTIDDLNADGLGDIIVSDYGDQSITVLRNITTSPFFNAPASITTADHPRSLATADFNGDGKADLVVADQSANEIQVLLGNGDGTFASPRAYSVPNGPSSVITADVNGDGVPDILVASSATDQVTVFLGNGDGTFAAPIQTPISAGISVGPNSIAVADVNGDGNADLIVADGYGGNVSILPGNGNGTFGSPVSFALYNSGKEGSPNADAFAVAVGDVNGDHHPDIVATNSNANQVDVLLNNGDGTFPSAAAARVYSVGQYPSSVALHDLNGDGKLDIVTANKYSNTVSVLLGNGDGTFADEKEYPAGNYPFQVVVADVNGDGKPDILTADSGNSSIPSDAVNVLPGNGDGTFSANGPIAVGNYPTSLAVADFNGDGQRDLATANANDNTLSILLNDASIPVVTLADGVITAAGSTGSDYGSITYSGGQITVNIDGQTKSFAAGSVTGVSINLGDGSDSLSIGPGVPAVNINGGDGNDTIIDTGTAPTTIIGGAGNDLIECDGNDSSISGGQGSDTLVANGSATSVGGGAGNDSIIATGGDDLLRGGAGDDIFFDGGASGDTINGGVGLNFAQNNPSDSMQNIFQVIDPPKPPAPSAVRAAAADIIAPAADVLPTAAVANGILTIVGTSSADSISVSSNGTQLTVTADGTPFGPFTISGLTGLTIAGKAANDTLIVDASVSLPATLKGGGGNDMISGGGSDNVIVGGKGNDTLTGGGGTNLLVPDRLAIYSGSPTGNDSLVGGSGFSIADFAYRTDALKLSNNGRPKSGDPSAGETSTIAPSVAAIWGGTGNDTINGANGGVFLSGGAGADSIAGGGVNDLLVGGHGKDSVAVAAEPVTVYVKDGKSGNDTVSGVSNQGEDILEFDAGDSIP
jgi:Ca2+-binding RTX toxin-like protein